jgi:hypothetical protein
MNALMRLRYLWALRHDFGRLGYFASASARVPVSADGAPIPWLTYPALAFIEPRIRPTMRVFEWGTGQSTLWWAARVASVRSVEHDAAWHRQMQSRVPANVHYSHVPLGPNRNYEAAPASDSTRYDVIVNDGERRNECAAFIVDALTADGVVIWDNSDREYYAAGYELLTSRGFRRIDFWGFGPIDNRMWCTSLFYRDGNSFGV